MPDFAVRTSFNAVDKISPAFRKMGNGADKFGRRSEGAFGRLNRATGSLMGAFRGLLPAISAGLVLKFANDSIKAWQQHEAAVAMVEQRLKSTNNALGLTSKELQDMASDFQKVGIFGDETILQHATSQLMTFGNIGRENFNRVQAAALDVTAQIKGVTATGNDLRSTAIMLGKALDDPMRGMSALRRVGISFTDAEEKKIKAMQRSGDALGAQNEMLRLIEKQYGGTNEALGETAEGMQIIARNRTADAMKQIGKALVPLRTELFNLIANAMPYLVATIPIITAGFKYLGPPILAVVAAMIAWKAITYGVIAAQKIAMAVGWVKYLWMMRAAIMKAVSMTKAWAVAQKVLNFILMANPIGLVILAIAALIGIGYLLIKNWEKVKTFFSDLWGGIKTGFLSMATYVRDKFSALLDWVSEKWNAVKQFFGFAGGSAAEADAAMSAGRQSPNQTQVQSQRVQLDGNINIAGAPQGSTAEARTRGPGNVNMQLAGVNP